MQADTSYSWRTTEVNDSRQNRPASEWFDAARLESWMKTRIDDFEGQNEALAMSKDEESPQASPASWPSFTGNTLAMK
jgi:hypothetical protein